jgi:hypothetical protein
MNLTTVVIFLQFSDETVTLILCFVPRTVQYIAEHNFQVLTLCQARKEIYLTSHVGNIDLLTWEFTGEGWKMKKIIVSLHYMIVLIIRVLYRVIIFFIICYNI